MSDTAMYKFFEIDPAYESKVSLTKALAGFKFIELSNDKIYLLKLPFSILKQVTTDNPLDPARVLMGSILGDLIVRIVKKTPLLYALEKHLSEKIQSLEKALHVEEDSILARINDMDGIVPVMPSSKYTEHSAELVSSEEGGVSKVEAKAKTTKGKSKTVSAEVIMAATPVQLKAAKNLYEPVKSTSAGSVYHVVARFNKVVVAARVKTEGVLSLRMEGDGYEDLIEGKNSGIDDKGGYASGHFYCGSFENLVKTYGAVMMSLGLPSDLPFVELKKLEGVGK